MLAVEQRVEHGQFERRALRYRRFARFQIELHAKALRECTQSLAKRVDRVAFAGKMNAAAKADPLDLVQQSAETFLDLIQHLVKESKISVLAIVVDHEAADAIEHRFDF